MSDVKKNSVSSYMPTSLSTAVIFETASSKALIIPWCVRREGSAMKCSGSPALSLYGDS